MTKIYTAIALITLALLLTAIPAVKARLDNCKYAIAHQHSAQTYSLIVDTNNVPNSALACATAASK